ncbi:hypothetical protein PIB30_027626 [Stylosanthes scabra]|uniref:Retrotransposon Copia-like N-terminal domain-containing protein n=1 Tax=Stylosanthes scabra TaxID=79078 RepID=A0ABU6QAW0_9FABA|nr:hypothetical protein [Stylosanthes scabra]
MALLVSAQNNFKNGLVPLADKLDENNFWSWKKSVLLTVRTLKLQDHLSFDKIPPQYEEILEAEADSDSASKSGVAAPDSADNRRKGRNLKPRQSKNPRNILIGYKMIVP